MWRWCCRPAERPAARGARPPARRPESGARPLIALSAVLGFDLLDGGWAIRQVDAGVDAWLQASRHQALGDPSRQRPHETGGRQSRDGTDLAVQAVHLKKGVAVVGV